jgi:hypothetical protein
MWIIDVGSHAAGVRYSGFFALPLSRNRGPSMRRNRQIGVLTCRSSRYTGVSILRNLLTSGSRVTYLEIELSRSFKFTPSHAYMAHSACVHGPQCMHAQAHSACMHGTLCLHAWHTVHMCMAHIACMHGTQCMLTWHTMHACKAPSA